MGRHLRILLLFAVPVAIVASALTLPASAAARPVLSRVGTGAGPLAPTAITLTGRNLSGMTAVVFGDRAGVVVGRSSASSAVVRTPVGARPGTVAVRVKTSAGWSSVTRASRYTFVAAPTLTRISPTSGYYSGGKRVTITGKNYGAGTVVLFGAQRATILTRTPGRLVVRAPIGTLGAVPVVVTTRGGATRSRAVFTYTAPPALSSLQLQPTPDTFVPDTIDWVTGGHDAEMGTSTPWVVELPRGAAVPAVGQQFLVRPGTAAYPSGLGGTATTVADQLDETVRVTVAPTDLEKAITDFSLDYSGPVTATDASPELRTARAEAASVDVGKAFEFSLKGPTPLICKDAGDQDVSVGADLTTTVTDVNVDQHVDFGNVVRKPSYDGAFTAELRTSGRITVAAAATCHIKDAWANAHRRVFPLGTSGATLSFGPSFEFKISGKGTWSIEDRTRTTFAVNAVYGRKPTFSRTARSIDSKESGDLSFEAEVTGGVSVQLGILDRAGLQAKVLLGASATAKATTAPPNVCVEGEVFGKLAVGVFLDVLLARWEADAFSAEIHLLHYGRCTVPETPAPSGEPEITSARLADAAIGTAYSSNLTTADGRQGTWRVVRSALPAGLSLAADGTVTGTPTGPVGDSSVLVDFTDTSGRVATTTIRIMVQPGQGLGGGDVQATLRWSGAADLDLHVSDPSGEEIYYEHSSSQSRGQLDHDANAGCSGPDENPVENIYWPLKGAPAGAYTVWVKVYDSCNAPLDWHLTVRRNGTTIIDQTGTGDSSAYSFDVGTAHARALTAVRVAAAPADSPAPPKVKP